MDDLYLVRPLVFLIQVIFGLYILVVILRFLFQVLQVDFHNPISQFIVKLTAPVLTPMRRFIPQVRGYDTASLVLAWLLKAVELAIIGTLIGAGVAIPGVIVWAIPALVDLVIDIFLFSVIVVVIVSWVAPQSYHPALVVLHRVTAPLMEPVRKLLPSMGGLDLSPMIVIVGLYVLEMLVVPPLMKITGAPSWVSAF